MKRLLILLGILCCAVPAYSQGQRYPNGDQSPVTSAQTPGGPIFSVPNATINWCNSPANGVPCTNKATTYTDITLTTPCSTATQITLSGTNSCVATTDSYGNWGVWVATGTYTFTITIPNGNSIGPFTVTLLAGGGGGSGTVTAVTGTPNQIVVTPSTPAPVVALPSAVVTPGSLSVTNVNGGNVSVKANCAAGLVDDGTRYVSQNGSDSNDGCSQGSAKKTWLAAAESLYGGTSLNCGEGTVYVMDGSSLNPTAGTGAWIMGSTDPNFSSPPAGWCRQSGPLYTVGIPKSAYGTGPNSPRALVGGGSGADINHPCIWISGVNTYPLYFSNLQCNYQGRPIVVGEDSNHSRSGVNDGGSSGITFSNVGENTQNTAGLGPGWDIVGGSFWLNFNDIYGTGNPNVNTPSANNSAAVLVDGTGNNGIGMMYFNGVTMTGGGMKVNPGTVNEGLQQISIKDAECENNSTPACVWITGNFDAVTIEGSFSNDPIGTLCNGGTCAFRYDGSNPDAISASNMVANAVPPIQGPMVVNGGIAKLLNQPSVSTSFLRQGLRGVIGGHLIGTSDVSRRQFGPASVRFANSVLLPASYITISGTTLTQNVADPSGGTGATRLTATGAAEGAYVASQSGVTTNVGDWFVYGAWVHSFTGNGYATSGNPLQIGLTSCTVTLTYGTQSPMPLYGGDGEWEWIETAVKIATVSGSPCQPNIVASADATHTLDIFGPVYYHVPVASAPSDNEMLEIANNLQSYDSSCVVGTTCNVSTETLNVAGGLGCAQKTVSAPYTLTARDCEVDVTGTTTITVPHAITHNFWVVMNADATHTVTVSPDSGTLNGGGSLSLSPDTGIAQMFSDGTNIWGVTTGSGGGGSSIFTSFQVGSASPITGTGNYLQFVATPPLVLAETGACTAISPCVATYSAPTAVTSAASLVEGEPVIGSNGSQASYSSAAYLDCSAFYTSDWSLAVKTCLQNLHALNTTAGIADARGIPAGTGTVNPYSAASSLPASGTLLLGPGTYVTPVPIVDAGDWSIQGVSVRSVDAQVGTTIKASSGFQATYATGTITVGTVGAAEVITGSGTTWTSAMLGCAFYGANGGTNSTYGIITVVGSSTSITLGFGVNLGSGAAGGSSYTIACPVHAHGAGSSSAGGAQFGMGATNINFDCNNIAGCIADLDWYGQQDTYDENVGLHNFTNIGLDLEQGFQNSGPWDRIIASPGSSCTAATIPIIVHGNGQFFKGVSNPNVGAGACSTKPSVGIDVAENGTILTNVDANTVVVGAMFGANTTAPVVFAIPGRLTNGWEVDGFYLEPTGTTAIESSNAFGTNTGFQIRNVSNSGTNSLIDLANSCTDTTSRMGSYIANGAGAILISSSAVSGCTPSTAAGTYTSANITVNAQGQVTAAANGSGGGGGSPGGATDATQYNAGGGTFGGVNSPTAAGTYGYTEVITSGAAVPQWSLPGVPVDAESGSTYTVGGSGNDRATLINTTNNTTSTAVTVPQPATGVFTSNYPFVHCNTGSVVATDTSTGSTVNGNATLVLQGKVSGNNPECGFWWTDNTNWFSAEILPTDANGRLQAAGMPAFTGDMTNTAGTLATTVSAINNTAFAGTTGHLVSFGATNVPADSNVVAANVTTQTSSGAANEICTYTTTNKVCVPSTANIAMGGTAATSAAAGQVPNSSSTTAAAWVSTVTLGASGTAGSVAMFPASGNFTTTWGSAATASNTILGFASAPATTDFISCVTSSTICTLTDTGIPATATGINTAIKTLTGCNTATYVYTPQGTDCVAPSGGGGGGFAGSVIYTTTTTATSGDNNKLVIMNCSTACNYALPVTQPASPWGAFVMAYGAGATTINFVAGATINGSATNTSNLLRYQTVQVTANTATGTDYQVSVPNVPGAGMGINCSTIGCVYTPNVLGNSALVATRNTSLTTAHVATFNPNTSNIAQVLLSAYPTTIGSGCSTPTTIQWTISYIDQNANTVSVAGASLLMTMATNGGPTDTSEQLNVSLEMPANLNNSTGIGYATTYTAGTCSTTNPSYAASIKVIY